MIKQVFIPTPIDLSDVIEDQLLNGDPNYAHALLGYALVSEKLFLTTLGLLEMIQDGEAQGLTTNEIARRACHYHATELFEALRFFQEEARRVSPIFEAAQMEG